MFTLSPDSRNLEVDCANAEREKVVTVEEEPFALEIIVDSKSTRSYDEARINTNSQVVPEDLDEGSQDYHEVW